MLGNNRDLVGDEVAKIHIHLHYDLVNQLGPIKCDVKSVGGRGQVGVRKNTPCLS